MTDITTDRFTLRPITLDDLPLITSLNGDPEVMRYLTGRAMTPEECAEDVEDALGTRWAVVDRNVGEPLGWVLAEPLDSGDVEIGWRFLRSAWGRGAASESAASLVDHLFATGTDRVVAQTMAVNGRSRAVMNRLGMRWVRTFHPQFDEELPGSEEGEVEYELTREEWERRRPELLGRC